MTPVSDVWRETSDGLQKRDPFPVSESASAMGIRMADAARMQLALELIAEGGLDSEFATSLAKKALCRS